MNKVLTIEDFVASLPLCERDAFESRLFNSCLADEDWCRIYSINSSSSEGILRAKEIVVKEMYSKEFADYETRNANH
jgi:hypothetical protein